MFVPNHYREPGGAWVAELIRGNPLALLTTVGNGAGDEGVPFATHLPVIADPTRNPVLPDTAAEFVGASLLGHMNRANPHWSALVDGAPVLLVFTGPHGYVSPTVYDATPCAPTWDFTAVHVRGVLETIPVGDDTLDVVRSTVTALEGAVGTGWDMAGSVGYFRQLLPGVGAFRVTVTAVDCMFKLSQEQVPDRRDKVRTAFACSAAGRHHEVADLIDRLPAG